MIRRMVQLAVVLAAVVALVVPTIPPRWIVPVVLFVLLAPASLLLLAVVSMPVGKDEPESTKTLSVAGRKLNVDA